MFSGQTTARIAYAPDRLVVDTLAGGGPGGPGNGAFVDGVASVARFDQPSGVAVDSQGNVFVSDTGNRRIRKISRDGAVTTFSGGAPPPGEPVQPVDGAATASVFVAPSSLAIDANQNLFVVDGQRVRKIAPDGRVSTVAGGEQGYSDGAATEAKFDHPFGLCIDAAANLYVGDEWNNRIRTLSPSGYVSTLAGSGEEGLLKGGFADGPGLFARFSLPAGLATDPTGGVYLADRGNHRIRHVRADGATTTVAGDGQPGLVDGDAFSARFQNPLSVVPDARGYLYVADNNNHRIRRIDPYGNVETYAGSGDPGIGKGGWLDGPAPIARFDLPQALAIDAEGTLYVADTMNHRIRTIRKAPDAPASPQGALARAR